MLYNFNIDQNGEYEILKYMLSGNTITNTVDRANQYGIPAEIAKNDQKLKDYLNNKYIEFEKELEQSLAYHKQFWDEKRCDEYKQKFESILGHEMPEYNVRLNCQVGGISNWSGTDISIDAFRYLYPFKSGHMVMLIIWESMLSQTFMDVRKKWSSKEINDKNVWGLSELTAVAGIYQTDFYPQADWIIGYPELAPFHNTIKKLYAERKSFADYLEKAVKFFQENPIG